MNSERDNELTKKLQGANAEEKAQILVGLADDMTYAQTAGFLTDDILRGVKVS